MDTSSAVNIRTYWQIILRELERLQELQESFNEGTPEFIAYEDMINLIIQRVYTH